MLNTLIIKLAVRPPKIESFDRFLFIGPHPDDIEIGAGATIAKLVSMGKQVKFLICTDGRFGDAYSGNIKGDKLASKREQESISSAKLLGVDNVSFLRLRDGCGYDISDLEKGIALAVGEFKPQVIFAPDPNSKSESHPDHLNTGTAARKIACLAPYPGIMQGFQALSADVQAIAYYMTSRPNRFVSTKGFLKKQLASIFECHKSQYPKGCPEAASISLYLKIRSVCFGIRTFRFCSAEGFRVVSKTQMHCLPEAGE